MQLVAQIPHHRAKKKVYERKAAEIRKEVFQRSMEVILEPIIQRQELGEKVACSDGVERKMIPLVAAYIADKVETAKATLVHLSSKTQCSCHRCLLKTSLFATFTKGKKRTKEEMRKVKTPSAMKKVSLSRRGNVLWELRFFDYENFPTEKLHSSEQVTCFSEQNFIGTDSANSNGAGNLQEIVYNPRRLPQRGRTTQGDPVRECV